MKERQSKTTVENQQNGKEHQSPQSNEMDQLLASPTCSLPISIPRVITFDGDTVFDASEDCYGKSPNYQQFYDNLQWIDDNEATEGDSFSSSVWVMMEHGLDNNGEKPWNAMHMDSDSVTALHLLQETSHLMSSPEKFSYSSMTSTGLILKDDEPNVSWPEDASRKSGSMLVSSSPAMLITENENLPGADNSILAPQNDESDEITNATLHYLLSSDDFTSITEAANKSAPNSSPFSTFRQNSTSIALQEQQVYLHKIQDLKEQVAQAQLDATHEAACRLDHESGATLSILRTPASAWTSSRKRHGKSTPYTPFSSASTVLPESLWERNKTLVKEIRFADQTCLELGGQKAALENQVAQLLQQYDQSMTTNRSLQQQVLDANRASARAEAEAEGSRIRIASLEFELHEIRKRLTERDERAGEQARHYQQLCDAQKQVAIDKQRLEAELGQAKLHLKESAIESINKTITIEGLSQQKNYLITDLKDESEKLSTLRDKLVKTYEASNEIAPRLEIETDMKSELAASREALRISQLAERSAKMQAEELIAQVEILQATIDQITKQMDAVCSQTAEKVKHIFHVMHAISLSLFETTATRLGALEDRLNAFCTAVEYLKDALVFDIEDEDQEDKSAESTADDTKRSHFVISHVSSVDESFSVQNQTADLQLMEEARANDRTTHKGKTIRGPPTTDFRTETSMLASPRRSLYTSAQMSDFDGLSHCLSEDVSMLSVSFSIGDEGPSGSENFLQHRQWLTALHLVQEQKIQTGAQTPALEVMTSCTCEPEASSADQHQNSKEASKQMCALNCKSACCESKLKWTEEELKRVRKERDQLAQQLESIYEDNDTLVSKNGDTLEEIVRLQEIAANSISKPDTNLRVSLSTFQAEKVKKEHARGGKNLLAAQGLKEELEVTSSFYATTLSNAEAECDQLRFPLEEVTAKDFEQAQKQTPKLTSESSKCVVSRARFEKLKREKEEAELKLRQKAIFPRQRKDGQELLQLRSTEERDVYEELATLRVAKEKMDFEVKSLTAALEETRKKYAHELADSELNTKRVSEQRDALRDEATQLFANQKNFEAEINKLRILLTEQTGQILQFEFEVRCLQEKLSVSKSAATELQATCEKSNLSLASVIASNAELKAEAAKYKQMCDATQDLQTRAEIRLLETNQDFNEHRRQACNELKATQVDREFLFKKIEVLSHQLKCAEVTHNQTQIKLDDRDAALREAEESRNQATTKTVEYRVQLEDAATNAVRAECKLAKPTKVTELAEARLTYRETETHAKSIKERMAFLEVELAQTKECLQISKEEAAGLQQKNHYFATKCIRLREYIRKLTKKCDEWEAFHERESNVLLQLKEAHNRNRQKASELAAICEERENVRYLNTSLLL